MFQEVHNTLAVEVDSLKEKSNNKSNRVTTTPTASNGIITPETLRRILDERDSKIRRERQKALKSLYFDSDDELSDDDDSNSNDQGAVAIKKEEKVEETFASILAKPRETKSVQTEETSENSSQADIAESMIWQFVNSDLRSKMKEVIEDTLRGRMQNTLHSLLDKALESMVEESFEQAAGDKTLDRVMDAVRKEVETVLDGCVKREVKKARQEIMNEVKACMDKISNNNNNNNKHLSANAKEFVPSSSPPQSSSSSSSLTLARVFSPPSLRPMTTLASALPAQQAPLVYHQQLAPHFK